MAYNNTIFRQMLQLISRLEFQNIVNRHKGDYRVRKLSCRTQFVHLLFAQLSGRHSLRDTIQGTKSQSNKLYHLGCTTANRSTLSDANNKRPYQIYQDTFFKLLNRVQTFAPRYKLKLSKKLYIMDSTTIDLCLSMFPWAKFRKKKGAVKIHTLIQADGLLPTFLHITNGKVNDAKAAKEINVPPESFIVFDKGYHDFNQYKYYKDNKIQFITRIKTNAAYKVTGRKQINNESDILSDEIIEFTGYVTYKKYPHPLRKIKYFDRKNVKTLIFLTNNFRLSATAIADIYRARWEIELFFKTIKQNLKIKSFMGTSKNAVLTQIWIAMIAYLLLSYHKFILKSKYSIQTLIRLIQLNLFERKSLKELICYGGFRPPDNFKILQYSLFNS
jgi:putative transposase